MIPTPPSIDRLYDLLALQATAPLSDVETGELAVLLAKWPHVMSDEFEQAAAAVQLAALPGALEPLSQVLSAKLSAQALPYIQVAIPIRKPSGFMIWGGWAVAASLLLALGWLMLDRRPNEAAPPLSPITQRTQLLAGGAKEYRTKPGTSTGSVVWDAVTQRGVLQLVGLTRNDPANAQYQLWIVDAGRTHREPVDGGVFDVNTDGTATVAIKPALTVREPSAFAVTVEPPGGVVVSERGRRGDFAAVMTAP